MPIKKLQGQLQKYHSADTINDYTLSSLLPVASAASCFFLNLEVSGRLGLTQVETKSCRSWLYVRLDLVKEGRS
jgi:hypothetical protein